MTRRLLGGLLGSVLLAATVFADNWPVWRGPNFDGVSPAKNVPTEWDAEKNVLWKIDLPGLGGSTPAVWEQYVFVTCGENRKNTLICLNRSGEQLWKVHLGDESPGKHRKGTGANPSPTTDGEHIYVYFKSGDLACVDFSGQVKWQRNLQQEYAEDTLWWDLGTSPVLVGDLLV